MRAICYFELKHEIPFECVLFYSKRSKEPQKLIHEIIASQELIEQYNRSYEELLFIEIRNNLQLNIHSNINARNIYSGKLNDGAIHIYEEIISHDDTTNIFENFEVNSVNLSALFIRAEENLIIRGRDEKDVLRENEDRWNSLVDVNRTAPSPILSPKLLRSSTENQGSTSNNTPNSSCGCSSPFKSPVRSGREYYKEETFTHVRMPLSVRQYLFF